MTNHPNRSKAPRNIYHRPTRAYSKHQAFPAHSGMMETGVGYVLFKDAGGKITERHLYATGEEAAAAFQAADRATRHSWGSIDDVSAARELGIYNGAE